MYCGKLIRTEESPTYKQVKCASCGHTNPVCKHEPDNNLPSAPGADTDAPSDSQKWAGMTDEEIAKQLFSRPRPQSISKEESERRIIKKILSPLLPRYDDLTLFTLSLAFVLLVLMSAELRQDLIVTFHAKYGIELPLMSLVAGFGMVCSFVNIFLHRNKSQFEKWAMLLFAVIVTGGTGIYAGVLMLKWSKGWLIVFPAWNMINGGLLLVLTRVRVIDTECIIDKEATLRQVLITAVAIPILLASCLYFFDLHWSITFSIATAYTMNLHNTLSNFLNL